MKKLSFVITVLLVPMIYQAQTLRYISDMRGLVDNEGTTHIFYRICEKIKEPNQTIIRNPVYHLNMSTMSDSVLIDDYQLFTAKGTEGRKVNDYQFIENNPAQYVYGGEENGKGYIKVYNIDEASYFTQGPVTCIQTSNENPDLIYFSMMALFYSTDRGKTWDIKSNWYTGKFVINPYNNSHIYRIGFSEQYGYYPFEKSVDGGNTFNVISDWVYFTSYDDYFVMQFDADNQHVYLSKKYTDDYIGETNYYLYISEDTGNTFSCVNGAIEAVTHYIPFAVRNIPCQVWSTHGNELIFSENCLDSYDLKTQISREIKRIFVPAGSQSVFLSSNFDIYEFTNDSLEIIKHIDAGYVNKDFYPLDKGNCWVYEKSIWQDNDEKITYEKIEVQKDTMIAGKIYQLLKFDQSNNAGSSAFEYLRHDPVSGFLVKFINEDFEAVQFDFNALVDDNIYVMDGSDLYKPKWILGSEYTETYFDEEFIFRDYNGVRNVIWWYPGRIYAKSIGLIGSGFVGEGLIVGQQLIGCVIDGVVYGDTTFTITNIGDEISQKYNFSLEQNYPNPFNPATKIKFSIPGSVEIRQGVSLRIYDVLGREITTLVNEPKKPGVYEVEFNASTLPSGIYFYRLMSGNFSETRKMILLK